MRIGVPVKCPCLAPEVLLGYLSTRKWAIVKVEALLRGPESYFVVHP